MSDTVEQIKEQLSIVDVVSPYVKLVKAGRHYKGLSPFTKEKTPSFFVSPDRGLYHCFSSGKGGDMFTFIEELEGVDFRGALALLAEKAGVTIANEPREKKDKREKVYALLEDTKNFFVENLNKNAQEYLTKRGLKKELLDSWEIGFAKDDWRALLEYATEKGYTEQLLVDAGLIKYPERDEKQNLSAGGSAQAGNKKPYDRFRSRIIFPIYDVTGRVVGFSGRIFGKDSENQAKYLNSPETIVFDKSRVLYGLNRAKEGIRKYDFAVLVEGQVDLLMAHQTGYPNSVALSGTGFTEHHAKLIKRYTENLVIAFDGDHAGVAAAGRAASISLKQGINVKIATLPPGKDPADVILEDDVVWKAAIRGAVHVVDFYLSYLKNSGYDDRRFKLEVSRVVLPYVALIPNAIDQAHFISRVAEVLSVPESAVEQELQKIKSGTPHTQKEKVPYIESTISHSEPFLSRGDTLERLALGIVQVLKDEDPHDFFKKVDTKLAEILGEEHIAQALESQEERRISLIEGELFLEENAEKAEQERLIGELLDDLENEVVRRKYRDAVLLLKTAEKKEDKKEIEKQLVEVSKLAKKL